METSKNTALNTYFKSYPNLNTYKHAAAIEKFIKFAVKNDLASAFIEAASNGFQNVVEAITHSERESEIGTVFSRAALSGHKKYYRL